MKSLAAKSLLVCGVVLAVLASPSANGASKALAPQQHNWSWEGVFGTFDKPALKRGLQVYTEVCAACHSLEYVHYRSLAGIGLSKAEITTLAEGYEVTDGPNEDGEMYQRPAKPTDKFVAPFDNAAQARAANGGALPPDLSLIVKARADGANYLASLLKGYKEPPKGVEVGEGLYYNSYFAGGQLAMPSPLAEDIIEYPDGTPASVDQMAEDITAFLAWAAEPHLEARKRLGFKVLGFLVLLTGLLGLVNRRIHRQIKAKH